MNTNCKDGYPTLDALAHAAKTYGKPMVRFKMDICYPNETRSNTVTSAPISLQELRMETSRILRGAGQKQLTFEDLQA